MDEFSYKNITAHSNTQSEQDEHTGMGKFLKISFVMATIGFFVPFLGNGLISFLNETNLFRQRADLLSINPMLILGVILAIAFFIIFYLIGKSSVKRQKTFTEHCFINVNESGISGMMVYLEKMIYPGGVNIVLPKDVREISFLYRQIDNVELKLSDIIIHVKNNQHACPNLSNTKEVFDIIQHNLRVDDKIK